MLIKGMAFQTDHNNDSSSFFRLARTGMYFSTSRCTSGVAYSVGALGCSKIRRAAAPPMRIDSNAFASMTIFSIGFKIGQNLLLCHTRYRHVFLYLFGELCVQKPLHVLHG